MDDEIKRVVERLRNLSYYAHAAIDESDAETITDVGDEAAALIERLAAERDAANASDKESIAAPPSATSDAEDADRWRYTERPEYWEAGPYDTDGDFVGFTVGIGKERTGRGKTRAEAIDAARRKALAANGRACD